MVKPEEAATVTKHKATLFRELDAIVNRDERLSKQEVPLPPSVLPYLLDEEAGAKNHPKIYSNVP